LGVVVLGAASAGVATVGVVVVGVLVVGVLRVLGIFRWYNVTENFARKSGWAKNYLSVGVEE